MPLERHRCKRCHEEKNVCPECGSRFVTPRDNPKKPSPNDLIDYGLGATEQTYKHVCWDCGWAERVHVTIERERVSG